MASPYASAARRVEAGFGMALRADEAAEAKRARKVQEERQAAHDAQATEVHGLRTRALKTDFEHAEEDRATKGVTARLAEIERQAAAAQSAGGTVDPALAREHGELTDVMTGRARRARGVLEQLSPQAQTGGEAPNPAVGAAGATDSDMGVVAQKARDFWSRAATGEVDPLTTTGPDLRMHLAAATGVKIDELPEVVQGTKDVVTGMQTANQGLVISGMNKAMLGRLRVGIGGESPYGGTITRKEIIGLDPAIDASGQAHPNRFIPRLRVYVQGVSPTGGEMYYDAPMTQNGSTEEGDKVVAIDVKRGMDWMGNMGLLSEIVKRPDLASKLGESDGGKSDAYIDAVRNKARVDNLTALTRPQPKVITDQRTGRSSLLYPDGTVKEVVAPTQKPLTPVDQARVKEIEARTVRTQAEVAGTLPARPKVGGKGGGSGGGSGGGVGALTDDAIDQQARAALQDRSVLSSRTIPKGDLARVLNRMAEIDKDGDLGLNRADYRAATTALNKLVPQYHAVTAFENNALAQGKIMVDLAKKVDATGVPVVERWIRAGRKAIAGDPDVSAFHVQLLTFRTEAARILTNPNLTGVLTVHAQKEVEHFLPESASAKQIESVYNRLAGDFKLREQTLSDQIDEVRDSIVRKKPRSGTPAPAPAAAGGRSADPLEGRTATGPNGEKIVRRNGQWVPQ